MGPKPSTVRCPYLFSKVFKAISSLKDDKGSTVRSITDEVHNYLKLAGLAAKPRNIIMQVRRALKYGLKKKFIAHRAGKYRVAPLGKKEPLPVDSLEIVDIKRKLNFSRRSSSRGKNMSQYRTRVLTRKPFGNMKRVGFCSMRSNNRSSAHRRNCSSPRKSILERSKSAKSPRTTRTRSRKSVPRRRPLFARKTRRSSPSKGIRRLNFGAKRFQSVARSETNSQSDCSDFSSELKIKKKKTSSISSSENEVPASNTSVCNGSKSKSVNFREPPTQQPSETAVEYEDKEHEDFKNVRPNSNDKQLDRMNQRKQTYITSEDEVRSIPRPRKRRRRKVSRTAAQHLDHNLAGMSTSSAVAGAVVLLMSLWYGFR